MHVIIVPPSPGHPPPKLRSITGCSNLTHVNENEPDQSAKRTLEEKMIVAGVLTATAIMTVQLGIRPILTFLF